MWACNRKPVYVASKLLTTVVVSVSVLCIVYGNTCLYMLFFPFFKVKMSKVHKN